MRSLASSSLVFLLPERETDYGYWVSFAREMIPRLETLFGDVEIVEAGAVRRLNEITDSKTLLIAVAPSNDTPAPPRPAQSAWIPRIGETVDASHPWSSSAITLLPLGAGRVDDELPVLHIGCGISLTENREKTSIAVLSPPWEERDIFDSDSTPSLRFADISSAEDSTSAIVGASIVVLWPPSDSTGLPLLLQAVSHGAIPLVPACDPILSYLCERYGFGVHCVDKIEAMRVAHFLHENPDTAERLRRMGRRHALRNLSWNRVFRRLTSALYSLLEPVSSAHVLVLNWNGKALLPDCFESLRDQEYPGMVPVLVDNGSSDDSVEFVRVVFPECRIIRNSRNLGFAEGNNVGIEYALRSGAQHVVLLNNDTRVAKHWLNELVSAAEKDPTIGAVGSRMLFFDRPRTVNSAGGTMNQSLYGWDRGVFQHDGREWGKVRQCLFVTGGSVLFRAETLEQVGLFDPAYFAYYEDNDLCHRLRLAGWRVVYAPGSKVFHKLSATSGPASNWKTFLLERSRYRFIMKNVPLGYLGRNAGRIFAQEKSEIVSWWNAREYRRVLIQMKAAFSTFLGLPGILYCRVVRSSGRDTGWTSLLEPGFARPVFAAEKEEFTELYAGLMPEGRVILACTDQGIDGEWSALLKQFPRFRMLEGHGKVRMSNSRMAEGSLQFHYFLPPEVGSSKFDVSVEETCRVTVSVPCPGWHTAVLVVKNVPAKACVELRTTVPIGFNEVSLLPPGSPLLRGA